MRRIKKEHTGKTGLEIAQLVSSAALDKKAERLVILDVRGISSFTDYFVIMSGRSTRHVQGLAREIDAQLSSKRIMSGNTEGLEDGLWVLLDYSDVVVHIFYKEQREFYDLEGLWHDAPRIGAEATSEEVSYG